MLQLISLLGTVAELCRVPSVHSSRTAAVALAALLLGTLPGCFGDDFPITIGFSSEPAPFNARLAASYKALGEDCSPFEIRRDLFATWSDPFDYFGTPITRCTDPDGRDRLLSGPVLNLTESISIEGCENPFLGQGDLSTAGPWIITSASCFDGQTSTFRIVAGEIGVGGSVAWETVLEIGDTFEGGGEFVDPRFIFPYISAGYDGEQPFFGIAVKLTFTGNPANPDIAIALCRRGGAGSWTCAPEYVAGQGALASFEDFRSLGVSIDCAPGLIAGDPGCAIPASPSVGFGLGTVFDPNAFPPPPADAIAMGFFDGGAPTFVANLGDTIPGIGFEDRSYASFGLELGWAPRRGAFAARDDQGDDYLIGFDWGDADEWVIAFEGDAFEGSDGSFDEAFGPTTFDNLVAFTNFEFEASSFSTQLVYQSDRDDKRGQLRTLQRTGVDVSEGQTISSADISVRGFDQRVLVNGIARESIADRRLLATPLRSFETLDDRASAVYGSDAIAGVVNVITRADRAVSTSHDVGVTGIESLAITPEGELFAGSGEVIDSPLYQVDRTTHQATLVGNTGIGGIVGLAATASDLYGTNGSDLYQLDETNGSASFIGAFEDELENPVTGVAGMTWIPVLEILAALTADGEVYEVDPLTAGLQPLFSVVLEDSDFSGISAQSEEDVSVSSRDGRLFQVGFTFQFGAGSGAGPADPPVSLVAILDTGDAAITGLAAEPVPEPAAVWLGLASLAALAGLRRRGPSAPTG